MKLSALHLSAQLLDGSNPVRNLVLEPGEAINRGLREDWTLVVHAPNGEGWALLVDDAPVPRSADGAWLWKPGFFAGLVEAQLHRRGQLLATYCLEVSPDADKLALRLYQQMLDELIEVEPMLAVGTEPATAKMGTLGSETDAWVEFRRFRQHAPGFLAAIRLLKQRPIRTVRSARRTAPIRAARRVDMQTIRAAAQTGTIGPLVGGFEPAQYQTTQAAPGYDLPWYEEHFDGPANRCIATLLLAVRRRAVGLLERLEGLVRKDADQETRTGLAERWPIRRRFLQDVIRDLKPAMRAEPFRSVTVAEISAAGLTAIAAHPVYSRAYRCGWSAIRRGLRASHASEAVWLCPSWELYERWCFGQVIKQLKTLTAVEGHTHWDASKGVWQARLPSGLWLRAEAQRTFSSSESAKFRSISKERRPDIVLTVESGREHRFITLDAKYSQSRTAVLNAMSSAHIYNDSLRWRGRRVSASLLMVPAGGGAPWLEEEAFHDREGVGILTVSPGLDDSKLNQVLQRLVHSVPSSDC